jgi:hypothetical protein
MEVSKNQRGRPRKDPESLARWEPPEGWVRVVAWVSEEERKSLKRMAIDANSSVAELIRSLASGVHHGVIAADDILTQIQKGLAVMEKIPTIFDRGSDFRVVDKIREGCEWVFGGEGTATEKLDGTNVRLTIRAGQCVRLEKRRNPTPIQKKSGIIDGWYVDADEFGKDDKWIYDAMKKTDVSKWADGEHSCEALGPNIQGNPLGLSDHLCVPFNVEVPQFDDFPRSYQGIRDALRTLESRYSPQHLAEGIVFHHPDGRRAKIKRKDFPANPTT